MTARRKCPTCGARLVPVVNDFAAAHGMGDESMERLLERERRGEIVLVGDCLPDGMAELPTHACPKCPLTGDEKGAP